MNAASLISMASLPRIDDDERRLSPRLAITSSVASPGIVYPCLGSRVTGTASGTSLPCVSSFALKFKKSFTSRLILEGLPKAAAGGEENPLLSPRHGIFHLALYHGVISMSDSSAKPSGPPGSVFSEVRFGVALRHA